MNWSTQQWGTGPWGTSAFGLGANGQGGFSGYAFYTNFTPGQVPVDLISGTHMQTTLSADRPITVNSVYSEVGEDVPTINELGLNTYGPIELLSGKTNDISDAYWSNVTFTVTGVDEIQATAQSARLWKAISTTNDTTEYILSFYARVGAGGQLSNYQFYHSGSATGSASSLTLTETRKRYSIKLLGNTGGGTVSFGFRDQNTSDWSKVYIDTINITQSAYPLQPVQNDTSGARSIALNHSDSDEGYKFQLTPDAIGSVYTGEVVGAELVTDALEAGNTYWDANTGVVFDGSANFDTNLDRIKKANALTVEQTYQIEITVSEIAATSIQFDNAEASLTIYKVITAPGTYTISFVATTGEDFRLLTNGNGLTKVTSLSIKQVARNMGASDAYDALDGIADGVDLLDSWDFTVGWDTSATATIDSSTAFSLSAVGPGGILSPALPDNTTVELAWEASTTGGTISIFSATSSLSSVTDIGASGPSGTVRFKTSTDRLLYLYNDTGSTTTTFTDISLKQISPAQGRLTIPAWVPMFDYDVAGIASGNIIYFGNGLTLDPIRFNTGGDILIDDNVTPTKADNVNWQANVPLKIIADWGPHPGYANALKMQLTVTDGTTTWQSAVTDFVGTFSPGTHLSFAFDNIYRQAFSGTFIEFDPGWEV